MKRIVLMIVCAMMIASFYSAKTYAATSIGSGNVDIEYPPLAIGYLDKDWQFQSFVGTPSLFSLSLDNLQTADKNVGVLGAALTGSSSVTKTDVTGKTIAVQNHVASYKVQLGKTSSPFPSIWLKGSNVNADSPNYLTGSDSDKFVQTGLTISAPYWEQTAYQWTLYIFADKDWLSQTGGTTNGKVLDPRVATVRWFAWTNDSAGIPKKMWLEKGSSGFNTLPLLQFADPASPDAAKIKSFLTGTTSTSLPEAKAGLPAIVDGSTAPTVDGVIVYNTARNTAAADNANGLAITGRSNAGLVYASPNDGVSNFRTEEVHVQFMLKWPKEVGGLATGARNCTISLYQRTAN